MNVVRRVPGMTREQFFVWAEAQNERYEFDGFQPVAMAGGTNNHDAICHNLWAALRSRLRGGPCRVMGPNAGLATVGDSVRYPDALITCSHVPGTDRVVPGVVVVFEVLSPTSGRIDRIDKLLEYQAVPSICRYVILEHTSAGATVYARGQGAWTSVLPLTAMGTLDLPEVGVSVPLAELYEGVEFSGAEQDQ